MTTIHFDVIVIGSGPAGEGAAMTCAKDGLRVALVEKNSAVGGACTHTATIPSKTLRHELNTLTLFRESRLLSRYCQSPVIKYSQLLESAQDVIERQVQMRNGFYKRNRVQLIEGFARFIDAHNLKVLDANGVEEKYSADKFVIASGSAPYHPPNIDFNHPRILDSDTILKLKENPTSLTIYGAGVVGCEYTSLFQNLEIPINLVNTRDRLLSFLDDEITDALSYHFRSQGVLVRHNEVYEKVEPFENGVILHLKSGKRIKTDYLLWTNGRQGNTCNMGLEDIGIKVNHRGQIEVNEHYHTDVENIYAAGDVVGYPSLASASYNQGRFAAGHLTKGKEVEKLVENIPYGIYTIPEISCIGQTEKELTKEQIPYEVGHSDFRNLARAQITGITVGMLKILFHRETLKVLGIHCFGSQATEIIHIGQAILSMNNEQNNISYFVNSTFNYPTMAEAYRVAALNGLNRLF
ncbi:Si-specific NAD(P)(+) transhydrogenase [Candidatus Riflebacteria bacterium]